MRHSFKQTSLIFKPRPHTFIVLPPSGGTFSPAGSVALQGQALLVVFDPQHAALFRARRLCGIFGQDHPDLPAVHVQVSALPHVDVLRSDRSGKTRSLGLISALTLTVKFENVLEGYVSV